MTTAVFDGKYLAADTRVTSSIPEMHRSCPSCEKEICKTHGVVKKLAMPPSGKAFLNGQKIIAYAGAGSLKSMRAYSRALDKSLPLEDVHNIIKIAGGMNDCSVIVVTEQSCWLVTTYQALTVKEVTEFPVAIGSGLPLALFACNYLNMMAFGAVGAASMGDPSTGGDIHYVDCRPDGGEPYRVQSDTWSDQEMRDHLKEMQSTLLEKRDSE